MQSHFFVYVYLNPEKVGSFQYDNLHFDYEPFYVGKGKGNRDTKRLERVRKNNKIREKSFLINKLKSLHRKNLSPIHIRVYDKLTEEEAFTKEKFLIEIIGRRDLKLGPLVNLTNGGDGVSGRIFSADEKSRISERMKQNNPCSLKNMSIDEIIVKNRKSGLTTKQKGLLKGSNHPLFNIGHSQIVKEKIKQNHADCSGKNNSHAKVWTIFSPENEIFKINGTLREFCKANQLSYSVLIRNVNKGKIKAYKKSTMNMNNWEIKS